MRLSGKRVNHLGVVRLVGNSGERLHVMWLVARPVASFGHKTLLQLKVSDAILMPVALLRQNNFNNYIHN